MMAGLTPLVGAIAERKRTMIDRIHAPHSSDGCINSPLMISELCANEYS
jgi:hypothetical protein